MQAEAVTSQPDGPTSQSDAGAALPAEPAPAQAANDTDPP
jgi:hypothetical protein